MVLGINNSVPTRRRGEPADGAAALGRNGRPSAWPEGAGSDRRGVQRCVARSGAAIRRRDGLGRVGFSSVSGGEVFRGAGSLWPDSDELLLRVMVAADELLLQLGRGGRSEIL
ncbi:hypothetical protein PR202_ga28358 [Eleusine coracana subsp. coracana]|uniref:Uncharacterized protein n=1 Tax=Eleusine coracana subsp. coracana TaxID=191504 RepID=A0AAV5DIW5_ELECO|nr:hypothetical protein PR202_ga28358 [Eleusine coracana subsp. coracana]